MKYNKLIQLYTRNKLDKVLIFDRGISINCEKDKNGHDIDDTDTTLGLIMTYLSSKNFDLSYIIV